MTASHTKHLRRAFVGLLIVNDSRPTLFIARDNRAGIHQATGAVYYAISGLALIVDDGYISSQIKPDEY